MLLCTYILKLNNKKSYGYILSFFPFIRNFDLGILGSCKTYKLNSAKMKLHRINCIKLVDEEDLKIVCI